MRIPPPGWWLISELRSFLPPRKRTLFSFNSYRSENMVLGRYTYPLERLICDALHLCVKQFESQNSPDSIL